MGFNLSLPPLVGLLLLAFLWLILLVLLVWFAFGRRRDPDEVAAKPRGRTRATRRTERADSKPGTSSRKPRASDQRTPVQQTSAQPAPRPTVRAVTSAERPGDAPGPKSGPKTDPKPDTKDAFDDFNQPDHRRDELDF